MGISSLSDLVTGQSLRRGEPVVALVVDRRTGGYPDATTHVGMAPLSASQIFESAGLPIRAVAGDYGGIEPVPGDPGAAFMLDQANVASWDEFEKNAFGVDAGILLGRAARGLPATPFRHVDDRKRVLGIAVFRETTWDMLRSASGLRDKDADVDAVTSAIARVHEAYSAEEIDSAFRNVEILSLKQSAYRDDDGTRTELPELARALSHREGGNLMTATAVAWLTDRSAGTLGVGLFRAPPSAETRRVLESVWDLSAAELGLETLGRTLVPSFNVGQYDNAGDVFGAAVSTLESCGNAIVEACEDWPENEVGVALSAMLERLDRVREDLATRLAATRVDAEGTAAPSR